MRILKMYFGNCTERFTRIETVWTTGTTIYNALWSFTLPKADSVAEPFINRKTVYEFSLYIAEESSLAHHGNHRIPIGYRIGDETGTDI